MARSRPLGDDDYERLLAFRDGLRRFLQWSEEQAQATGLTPAQHQLLLAIRGHPGDPTVGEVAQHLLLRHHSVVELVDRAERVGLVRRSADPHDHRVVHLALTDAGATRLADLSSAHLDQLARLGPGVAALWEGLA